jgi:hypothetical protein
MVETMNRVQLLFVSLGLMALIAICPLMAQQSPGKTPGFQCTVNNYGVGMNPDEGCRHPPNGQPACSQWIRFKFQACENGVVHAPFVITNDSLHGFCGRVVFVVKDRVNGKILGTFKSGRYCIAAKSDDTSYHERRSPEIDWTFQTDPAVGKNGHDLYGYGEEYEDTGLDPIPNGVKDAVKVGEKVFEIAAPIILGAPPAP